MTTSTSQSTGNRVWRWLDERLGLDALHYEVPAHANTIFYTLGGLTLGGILILLITGVYMTQFYHPAPAEARDSVIYLMTRVSFGEFARSVHYWTANIVIVSAVLHLVRVYFTASYKRPREMNWVIGVSMLTLLVALFFTGTVLKWDQEAYEALEHNEAVARIIGRFGSVFTTDFTVSSPLLTRLSYVHTTILPGVLTFLVLGHLFLVKHHGISPRPLRSEREEPGVNPERKAAQPISYFDLHLRQLIGYGFLLGGLAGLLALAIPATIGQTVVTGEEMTKPPWLFWWLYAFEDWWGIKALLWGAVAVPVGLLLVPFVDRTPFRHIINRRLMLVAGLVVIAAWLSLTIFVGVTPSAAHLGMGLGG